MLTFNKSVVQWPKVTRCYWSCSQDRFACDSAKCFW